MGKRRKRGKRRWRNEEVWEEKEDEYAKNRKDVGMGRIV